MTLVYAKTDPDAGIKGISAFIVEKGTPEFTYSVTGKMLGFRGIHHCESVFEDCRVPKENLIGKEGEGFQNGYSLDSSRYNILQLTWPLCYKKICFIGMGSVKILCIVIPLSQGNTQIFLLSSDYWKIGFWHF